MLPGGGHLRYSVGLSRGVDERESRRVSAVSSCSQMESRCGQGSGRVSVGSVHGVGLRYPGVPAFRQLLSRSELARRCQSCGGPHPPQGGAEEDHGAGGPGHVLVDGGRESSVFMRGLCPELRSSCVVSTCGSGWDPVLRGSEAVTIEARVLGRAPVEPPRWPGRCCSTVLQGTGPADTVVVKGSIAHRNIDVKASILAGLDV